MNDGINRQDAIDAICKEFGSVYCWNCANQDTDDCEDCHRKYMNWSISRETVESVINGLPSSERTGHWIIEHEPFTWMGYTKWHCSCCGFKCGYEQEIKNRTNCCPDCGARMTEGEEE